MSQLVCKFCFCPAARDMAGNFFLQNSVLEERSLPKIGKSFQICGCPCHEVGSFAEADYIEAVVAVFGDKLLSRLLSGKERKGE